MAALTLDTPVAVIGSGAMGAGIAQVAAVAGHRVFLYDAVDGVAAKAVESIGARFARSVARGRMDEAAREAALARLHPCAALGEIAPAGLVVEAASENLDLKKRLVAEVESLVGADAIIATNTSSLSVNAIAAALERPARFLGMHFFNPAPVMALVEVASGMLSDGAVADTVFDTAAAWGKTPVRARATPGFIVNRIARPFYLESLRILEEGYGDPATIDAVLREAGGYPMGGLQLLDFVGIDISYHAGGALYEDLLGDRRFAVNQLEREMTEAGRLGRKTGRGFYDYGADAETPAPATAAPGPAPSAVACAAEPDHIGPLIARLEAAGVEIGRAAEIPPDEIHMGDLRLRLTDGRMATEMAADVGAPVVLFDLALDYATVTRIAIAAPDQAPDGAVARAAGLFQASGIAVSVIGDCPAMIVMRTVAGLVNESADAILTGVCAADAVDTALMNGVNHPRGPLAWRDALGAARIMAVVANLADIYPDGRYRPSPLLRRWAAGGVPA